MAGVFAFDGLGDGGDVFRGVSAAASDEVEVAFVGEIQGVVGHVLGEEVEAGGGEGVGEAGVRVAADVAAGDF